MNLLIPMQWVGMIAVPTLFTVMFAIGLMLGPAQVSAAMTRRTILLAVLFAAVVPLPVVTVVAVELFKLRGPIGLGLLLMAISPGAPFALRRAIDAGGQRDFAPALHIAIVTLAVVTVPLSVAILDALFSADFQVTYLQIGKQVFIVQLLPLLLGALIRYLKPGLATWLEPRMARGGNVLLAVFSVLLLIDIVPIIAGIGYVPTVAGAGMALFALAMGSLFAGRDAEARPAAAIAVAMRNPGLALVIAEANHAPPAVSAVILGYTVGVALVVSGYLWWKRRQMRAIGL
jgi:bile acid:Na+ symporter, BASS family